MTARGAAGSSKWANQDIGIPIRMVLSGKSTSQKAFLDWIASTGFCIFDPTLFKCPMPGMGDVDSLLDSLDIPPQPSDREADTASPETPDQAVDALLNDFNAPAASAAPAATASATEVAAEPRVNLNAPDLDELLASVGAAPQSNPTSEIDDLLNAASPTANLAAEAAPAAPQKTFSNDDLDSLLEAAAGQASGPSPIMTAEPAPQPVAAPQPATVPQPGPSAGMDVDIDSLLAAAANDMQQNFEAEQATAEPAPAPVPVSAPPTAAVTNDDLDSLLAAATAGLEADPSPAPAEQMAPQAAPAASGDLGVDIDSLLAAAANDLEQTLDAAQQDTPAMPEAAAEIADAPKAETAPQADIDLDLDSLLAAVDAKAAPEAAAEPQGAPEIADPFADALQAVADATPAQPGTAPEIEAAPLLEAQPEPAPEPVSEPEFEAESAPEPEAGSEQVAQPELTADTQPEIMELLPEDQTPETATADVEEVAEAGADTDAVAEPAADIEAMMAAAAGEALSADGSAEQDIPAESVDDLLAAMSADLSVQPEADILPESGPEAAAAADDAQPLFEPSVEPSAAFVEEPIADFAAEAVPEEDPQNAQPDLHEFEASHAALAAQLQDDTDPTALESQTALDTTLATVSAEALEAVMTQANEASSHALDAFAQAFDASTRAADAAEAVGNLAARVEQCERALQEAGDRIIALETALETQIAVLHNLTTTALPRQELEGMFMEGHPLYQGLMECISKAVAETLAASPAPSLAQHAATADVQAQIDEHLQPVITAARIATARIDSLENRLDALEPRFNDRIEKAAAAAAARILREEIGRLLEE